MYMCGMYTYVSYMPCDKKFPLLSPFLPTPQKSS